MPEVRQHGRPYQEPERHNELSDGEHAPVQAAAGQERTALGRLTKGASKTPSAGGRSRKGRTKLSHEIESLQVSETLQRRARFMRRRACSELAENVGGGTCGILASVMVKLASEDLAMREAALVAGNVETARKLGESVRMHLVYARELVAKDAQSRASARPANPHAALVAALSEDS